MLGLVVPAQAVPGDLDASFSGDGKQTTDFGGTEFGGDIALQADSGIVVAGETYLENPFSSSDFALARYKPDGSLDSAFSDDGRQATDFGGAEGGTGVALQADGKVVVVGATLPTNTSDFVVARHNPDGSLDRSFSDDGRQKTGFGGSDGGHDVAVQADGKPMVVGYSERGPGSDDFALARYDLDGSLDSSFSGNGRQTTDFGGADLSYGLAIQADGKLVVAGSSVTRPYYYDTTDFALARYEGGSGPSHTDPGPTPQPQPQPPTSTLPSTTPTGRRAVAQRRCRRAYRRNVRRIGKRRALRKRRACLCRARRLPP